MYEKYKHCAHIKYICEVEKYKIEYVRKRI